MRMQLFVPAGYGQVGMLQPKRQGDLPRLASVLYGEGHVVALVADLAGHTARTPLVAVVQAGDPWPRHDPCQQAHHVRGREVAADVHHHIDLGPAHQPGNETAGDQQRTGAGDERGQVQPGEYLTRLLLQCGLPGQQVLISRG
jgi:hypothetical protein